MKVYGSELYVEAYRELLEVLGPGGLRSRTARRARSAGPRSNACTATLILTFGGGTNEVQRDIIAMAGMGMPHYKS